MNNNYYFNWLIEHFTGYLKKYDVGEKWKGEEDRDPLPATLLGIQ